MRCLLTAVLLPLLMLILGIGTAQAEIYVVSMGANVGQVNGVTACYSQEIQIVGSGLSPITVTPSGKSAITIPLEEPGFWSYESDNEENPAAPGCFASLAELVQAFPRDNSPYAFSFGGLPDSDTLLYSNVDFPSCFADITSPVHGSTTATTTPTISWSVSCSIKTENCHYSLEHLSTENPILENFDTDCPGTNNFQVQAGELTPGETYLFWVELTDGDGGKAAATDTGSGYAYHQGTQNSNQIVFTVPEPSTAILFPVSIGAILCSAWIRRHPLRS